MYNLTLNMTPPYVHNISKDEINDNSYNILDK